MLKYFAMSTRSLCNILTCAALTVGLACFAEGPAAPSSQGASPKMQFESTTHDFGRAMEGEHVKYTYVFTNGGDETLQVSGVHACGCITIGDYSKSVEPGKSGVIPISFNSANYNGPVTKTINVTSNDKQNPRQMLYWKGTVWKGLEVNPQVAILNVTPDAQLASQTVHIVNNLEAPITISEPESNNRQFAAKLKPIKDGKEFEVVVSTVPPLTAGNLHGEITLKTSSPNLPAIKITAFANLKSPLEANPAIVQLPVGPLTNEVTRTVEIVNKGSKPIILSEPRVNVAKAEVALKEIQAGFKYEATLTFGEGFEIPRGQRPKLTVKSNEPIAPELQVNIFQPGNFAARPGALSQTRPIPPPPVAGH